MKKGMKLFLTLFAVMVIGFGTARAQNVASNKAYFGAGYNELTITNTGNFNNGQPILSGQLKTSSAGDLLIGVSMECALLTNTKSTIGLSGPNSSLSTSRAAVNITVLVDGVEAHPGEVVYCDRLQQTKLTFTCDVLQATCLTNSTIDLELFLKTKEASHFNFYLGSVGSGIHTVQVFASGLITNDPNVTLSSGTQAAIGKRTLVIEDFNSSNQ